MVVPANPAAGATYFTYPKSTEVLRYEGPARSFELEQPITGAPPSTIIARHKGVRSLRKKLLRSRS